MSLQTMTCVVASCDACRRVSGGDHDHHFPDVATARSSLAEEGWQVVERRLLCGECAFECRQGEHAWRQLTAQPGVFGATQVFPQPFVVCTRCEVVRQDLDLAPDGEVTWCG